MCSSRALRLTTKGKGEMNKWADFLITAVRYSAGGLHIESVQVHADLGDALGPQVTMSRAEVVKNIAAGKTFCTAVPSTTEKNKLVRGALVSAFPVQTMFIKTQADKRESDNLENLPSF